MMRVYVLRDWLVHPLAFLTENLRFVFLKLVNSRGKRTERKLFACMFSCIISLLFFQEKEKGFDRLQDDAKEDRNEETSLKTCNILRLALQGLHSKSIFQNVTSA